MIPTDRFATARVVELFIPGKPQPKGSWRPMRNPKTGKTYLEPDCPDQLPWSHAIAAYVRQAWIGAFADAVFVDMTFVFIRPASASASEKKRPYSNVRPDADKADRAAVAAVAAAAYATDPRAARHALPVLRTAEPQRGRRRGGRDVTA